MDCASRSANASSCTGPALGRQTLTRAYPSAHVPLQGLVQRHIEGLPLQCPPDSQDQAAARDQHTRHLAEPCRPVGKEFEPVLTEHDVESRIREGESCCIALTPLDGRT